MRSLLSACARFSFGATAASRDSTAFNRVRIVCSSRFLERRRQDAAVSRTSKLRPEPRSNRKDSTYLVETTIADELTAVRACPQPRPLFPSSRLRCVSVQQKSDGARDCQQMCKPHTAAPAWIAKMRQAKGVVGDCRTTHRQRHCSPLQLG